MTRSEIRGVQIVEPSVELVGSMDNRKDAWITSRPTFDHADLETELDKLFRMDLSMNSIASYTFNVSSSTLFRDLMLVIRPIAPWCRSLRSAPLDLDHLAITDEGQNFSTFEDQAGSLLRTLEDISDGTPQDVARDKMPMMTATDFTVAIDHRTLLGFIKSMIIMDIPKYPDLFLTAIDKDREWLDEQAAKPFHNVYTMTKKELSSATYGDVQHAGELLFTSFTTSFSHAAQFIRQHHNKVKTDIWSRYDTLVNSNSQQGDDTAVCLYADAQNWMNTVKLRSHWFADFNKWSNILSPYIEDLSPTEFFDLLPNGNGKRDPYERDMISRINLEELNLPCPIQTEWPDLIKARINQLGHNVIIHKYVDLIEDGLLTDNPENEHRKKFIANLEARYADRDDDPFRTQIEDLYKLIQGIS